MEILDSCAPAGGEVFPVPGLENNSEEITVDPDFTQTHKRHSLGEGEDCLSGYPCDRCTEKKTKRKQTGPMSWEHTENRDRTAVSGGD